MNRQLEKIKEAFGSSGSMLATRSPRMARVMEKLKRAAPTESTVLISGETGTGKGVMARFVHDYSSRCRGPFVVVHCGAIPESLIESELFGHERGAFTGAVRKMRGRFEQAAGGTIFLDEIGTITMAAQIKLLQVLQDRTFQTVGGEESVDADARVIAASNEDLSALVSAGDFRMDLYYRLNVFPVSIPPLRERLEDLTVFIDYFIAQYNRENNGNLLGVSSDVERALHQYDWPGNIREVENLIHRAAILEKTQYLTKSSFPRLLFTRSEVRRPSRRLPTLAEIRKQTLESAEREYLAALLTSTRGRISKAAEAAGVSRRQIYNLLSKYNIDKKEFKNP